MDSELVVDDIIESVQGLKRSGLWCCALSEGLLFFAASENLYSVMSEMEQSAHSGLYPPKMCQKRRKNLGLLHFPARLHDRRGNRTPLDMCLLVLRSFMHGLCYFSHISFSLSLSKKKKKKEKIEDKKLTASMDMISHPCPSLHFVDQHVLSSSLNPRGNGRSERRDGT